MDNVVGSSLLSPEKEVGFSSTLEQLQLTGAEMAEAEKFFTLRAMEDLRFLSLEALTTKNIGFQYLIVQDGTAKFVGRLSRNINLHLEIVPMIIGYCQKYELGGFNPLLDLALNQTIFSELVLYKKIFALLMEEEEKDGGVLRSHRLRNMLKLRTGDNYDTNFGMSGVDTLLFLLSHITNNADNLSKNLVALGEEAALQYAEEINVWVTERYPDFAEMPVAWVLKALDFR